MSATSWFLVSSSGTRHRLPREMIFVGREDCELMLQSRSVDKQHAVINFDNEKDEHRVKDLGSLNGTFVNDVRIPDQRYITLKLNDVIRFGYDFNMYVLEQIQHKVPEEALKHEKYTSQLQMSLKTPITSRPEQNKEPPPHVDSMLGKQEKADKKAPSGEPSIYRTPLYGQPSWWGDDDANNKHEKSEDQQKEMSQHDEEMNGNLGYKDSADQSLYSFRREPSYFEIPTKDFQQPAKSPETQVHEIPTKDTDTTTPPVVQSHASFTIEFDDCRPGRIKIKDHVTKFSMRQKKPGLKETGPNEMMSVENKVADWLVQNDPSLIRRATPGDDVYSTKSDLAIHISNLKGNRHEDGTQSDSEDPAGPVPEKENAETDQAKLQRQIKREPEELLHNQQAFVIEFFDDDAPRKKRSQSFTHSANGSQNEAELANKGKNDKKKSVLTAEKLTTNGTTTAPVVPKPLVNSSFPQRSNSFRREKGEDRVNTTGPVTAKPPVKSFGSIGKKSKLAQEFVEEYLREQAEVLKDSMEKPMMLPLSTIITPPVSHQVQSSLMGPSAPPSATEPSECRPVSVKKTEEEDSLSDAGTYTIETDNQDKEVEEARKMIDQVFGVFEPEEYSKISSVIYRPVIKLEKEEAFLNENSMIHKPASLPTSHSVKMNSDLQPDVQSGKSPGSSRSGQKWVSRWASLADSYPDASPTSPLDGQMIGLLANEDIDHSENSEGDPAFPLRTRRLLPQLPPNDKSESPTPTIFLCTESYSEVAQKTLIENEVKTVSSGPNSLLFIQEDLDPDSLSDTSKSDDGVLSSRKSNQLPTTKWRREDPRSQEQSVQRTNKLSNEPKSTSFYVGNEIEVESLSHANSMLSNVEMHKPYKAHDMHVKPKGNQQTVQEASIITKIDNQLLKKENGQSRDSFVRQESFTKDKSSCNISSNKLPNISTHPLLKDMNVTKPSTDYSRETQQILKETENALAALEAKLFSQNHVDDDIENTPCPPDDSLSGDSDVDTASTVSLVSDKNVPSHPQKGRVVGLHKEKSSSTSSIQDQYGQPSARDRLSEKRRMGPADGGSRKEVTKRFEMKRSTGTRGSLDFTDEERSTSLPYISIPDTVSSDYENSSSRNLSRRRPFAQSTKEDISRISSNAQKIQQALTRSNSLSTPRPTRASKLRRARLGEASDNESADAERLNVSSEASSSAKSSSESKKLSRLDILAMPRKRTGSFNVPSDSETYTPRTGFSGRSVDHSYTNRKPAMAEAKQPVKKPVVPTPKQPLTRARSGSVKYSSSSSSRRRQQGSDYISTSEEEYGSNHSTPKHKRSHTSTATQTPRTPNVPVRPRQSTLQDDDDDDQEVYNNFMAQSEEIAEIARLSQTLVNDVASLAKEIHDVAGDGDSQSSSGTGNSTSISSIPNTPGPIISAREEILKRTSQRPYPSQLVHHIPEASLNYQKVPPGSTGLKDFDQSVNDYRDEDPMKRRARNREEVIFDNLMLNPVSQLSHTICSNTEILTEKMKVLFLNKEKSWEEIEAKMNSENEVPILKTSNKEISSILKVLRRVQKQLEVINAIVDPAGHFEVIPTNKKIPPVTQTSAPQARTNSTVSKIETRQPVRLRNYMQKSSSGSSRSPESSFGRDEEDAYV
ncbi:centrosomal protein of 170 kDa protein B isoform X1 [Bufo bufo]|uniref:centrosomal protein of 170 kDa protein B isoform X1 n=1 Tax=Bufo bufo TaxID=8384 RepID=UPI001ABED1D4|nr:centrosomal protein of 170 kDa protein B isoform X1 [Bufo bufo]XP_040268722.1 centrosomal protein of 170 kDa protein B isoform X1 [Bufo bufo]